MYSVSNDYLTKLFNISKKRRVVLASLDGVSFDENDIIASSLKYTQQCVGGAEINLGGVFLGQLWLTFTKPFADNITRGTWKGKEIDLSIGLEIDPEEETIEYVPIGKFYVEEANHVEAGVEIVAYDSMRKFDKNINTQSTAGSFYSLVTFACNRCGVTLGMTEEEIEALPNGDEVFSEYPENDIKTFRDFISWLAVTMGGFATINREGNLEFRGWNDEPVISMGINDRYAKGSWSDFHTYYTGISVTNIAEETTSYYHVLHDDGLTMNVGANPFLQYGLEQTKERQRNNILNALENFDYVPFKVSAFADPFFDLGDIITFTDGLAGTTSKCCVMRIDFSFSKGITMQGFGKNPALFGAQSKTDKNIAGLMSKNQENFLSFVTYTNSEAISLNYKDSDGLQSSPIATLYVSPIKDTNIDVNTRVIYEDIFTAGNSEAYVKSIKAIRYELDGDLIARIPYEDVPFPIVSSRLLGQDRNNTIEDYQAILNVKAGDRKTLIVYLEYEVEGTATDQQAQLLIGQGGINITLRGQGLSTEEAWDGFIRLSDEYPYTQIGGIGIEDLEDSVEVTLQDIISIDLDDEFDETQIVGLSIEDMEESISITLVRPTFNVVDESGEFNIITEDGYNIITE